ncbi:MAG: LPS-assembly protein [Yoonia sp.]|jgi:LPS-assembly protein
MRALLAFLWLFPTLALSQGAATLVANTVTVQGGSQLVASGNIEVFYDGTRLSAAQVIYDQASDRLTIIGPILIQAPDGTIITADRASLDPKLENGMLRGARLVLDQQLQLAANQIDRVDGRYSQLYKVAATSCKICGTRAPLWEIRAKKVVHDEDAQQLYFTDTQFLIRGTPVLWLPRMRLPDPTLTRATGLLIPTLKTTDQLGTGLKVPYFFRIGDHRDVTLTPYLSAETRTLEGKYRQAFFRGTLTVDAAISEDTLSDGARSYLFAQGAFDLGQDYALTFDVESASDNAYLLDYGYSDKDRLDSAITLLRVRETDLTQANLTYYQTLRDDEDNASLPPITGSISYENRAELISGATFRYGASADTVYRYGTTNPDGARDVSRAGANASVTRDWVTRSGLVVQTDAGVRADWYGVNNDTSYDNGVRVVPHVGLTLQYPLATTTANGTQHLLEPTIAFTWSDAYGVTPPNEDSTRSELDQANLFDAARFTGDDAVEVGTQTVIGAVWTRFGAQGAASTLTFGRILRDTDIVAFNPSSGLDGTSSDWLLAGQYTATSGFEIDGRTLFDDDANITRAATRLGWQNDWVDLNAAYIWQAADATESRPDAVSEWTLDSTIQLAPAWAVNLETRYDVANDQPAFAGAGMQYKNECVTVDLSVSRRYTSSTTVDASTSYGLSVSLNGFSAKGSAGPAATCAP